MWFLKAITAYAAPIFLVLSPITSYADQALSMHKKKSSAGFSLDIPLIMLVASLLRYGRLEPSNARDSEQQTSLTVFPPNCRIFYYPGARYDTALLAQAVLAVGMQLILLKVALDHRPAPASKGGDAATPFSRAADGIFERPRPYSFWQWRSPKPYVPCGQTKNPLVDVFLTLCPSDTGNSSSTSS
jgi:hypothetical protein